MTQSYVVATVAGQRVALDATSVEAIVAIGVLTPIPCAPAHVSGLCAVRSTVLTVIDVASAAGVTDDDRGDRAAVVLHDGHRYALRVGRVDDVEVIDTQPSANDASIGRGWFAVAPNRIETTGGAALLLEIGPIVQGVGASGRD